MSSPTCMFVCSPVCSVWLVRSACMLMPACVWLMCVSVCLGTCRSFLPSGLCGGPLFGVIKVMLGFPVARVSCDLAPCPAQRSMSNFSSIRC